jgi:hypothetical protein
MVGLLKTLIDMRKLGPECRVYESPQNIQQLLKHHHHRAQRAALKPPGLKELQILL